MSGIYQPCRTGIHVCGCDVDEFEPVTVANYPTLTEHAARAAFDRAKVECETTDHRDVVIDLMIGGDIVEDFGTTRQMLPRLQAAVIG